MTTEQPRRFACRRLWPRAQLRKGLTLQLLLGVAASFVPGSALAQHTKLFQLLLKDVGPGKQAAVDWAERVGTEFFKKRNDLEALDAPLSPADEALDPEYPSSPLPSRCRGLERTVCRECGYEDALAELDRTRYRLEKLRRVGAWTKNYVSHSLAVGDSLAGAAGLSGLAWVEERGKILQSYQNFKGSYAAKYAELMGLLQETLQQISECEALVYGEESWYDRFGFMYYEFMAARYQWID